MSGKQKCISDASQDWDRRMKNFREHIAIYGLLKRVSGLDAACGWALVQLDQDMTEEPWSAIYGTMLAALEVQRTIKSALSWALTMAVASLIGPSTIHTENLGNVDGSWRREEACTGSKQLAECAEKNGDPEVNHVKVHRTEKEKKATTNMQECVIEGPEQADE